MSTLWNIKFYSSRGVSTRAVKSKGLGGGGSYRSPGFGDCTINVQATIEISVSEFQSHVRTPLRTEIQTENQTATTNC